MEAHPHSRFPKKENAIVRFVNKRRGQSPRYSANHEPSCPCVGKEIVIGNPIRFFMNYN